MEAQVQYSKNISPLTSLHHAAWPDMFANLQAAYVELTQTQTELEHRVTEINDISDLFERVIESMSEALFLMDITGQVIQVNNAASILLGRNKAELIGRPLSTVFDTTVIPATPWQLLAWSPDGMLSNLDIKVCSQTGPLLPLSLSCGLVRDRRGKITGVLIVARDVTERKQAEEALHKAHVELEQRVEARTAELAKANTILKAEIRERRQAEAALAGERNLLLTLINNLPDYIYVKDIVGHFVISNVAVARLMGASGPDELVGKTDFDFYPQELATQYYASEQVVIRSGQPLVNREEPFIDSAGNLAWLLTTKVPLQDGRGKIVGLVGIGRDITRRKQIEEEKARLLEAVSQQREELRALAVRLAEVQEAERQQLARELHDQVGQNLSALGFNLNFVRTQMPPATPTVDLIRSRLDDSLALVEQTGERVRDVLAELRPPVLDDYGLVDALDWYAERFSARVGLAITVQGKTLNPRLAPPVENALFRIAQEALTNVAKHAQATQVKITVEENNTTVCLMITDNGIGFASSVVARPAAERQGWGLLTMTERAVAVDGCCLIESQLGQGTRVTVRVKR